MKLKIQLLKGVLDIQKIRNIKRKVVKQVNPSGIGLDAVAELKSAMDEHDTFFIFNSFPAL